MNHDTLASIVFFFSLFFIHSMRRVIKTDHLDVPKTHKAASYVCKRHESKSALVTKSLKTEKKRSISHEL